MSNTADQTVVRMQDFRAGGVRDRVSDALDALSDQVSDSWQDWRSKARSAASTTDGFVRSRPWHAVGAIALVSLAAGIWVSNAAKRSRRPTAPSDSPSEFAGG